jgi:tetratricopeptide (TPR) repeat protein
MKSRPIYARLSGFNYVEWRVNRGGEREIDPSEPQLDTELAKVLEKTGNDPKSLHDRGVALLLYASMENPGDDQDQAKAIAKDKRDAVALLQSAATRVSDNVTYQNDLAVALIATGDYKQASTVCERALQIEQGSRDALFNKAIALSGLDPHQGVDAFNHYLAVDAKSPWADEARRKLDNLQ